MTDTTHQAIEAAVENLMKIAQTCGDLSELETALRAALTLPQEVAAEVEIDAALLKLSAETHKAVDETIHSLQKLEDRDPIPAQWWGVISMALYKASLLGAASRSPAPAGVAGGVDARRDAVMRHDYPILQQFHSKHALGALVAPSCLCCGKSTQGVEIGVRHMELPGVVICEPCKTAATQAQPSPHPAVGGSGGAPEPIGEIRFDEFSGYDVSWKADWLESTSKTGPWTVKLYPHPLPSNWSQWAKNKVLANPAPKQGAGDVGAVK